MVNSFFSRHREERIINYLKDYEAEEHLIFTLVYYDYKSLEKGKNFNSLPLTSELFLLEVKKNIDKKGDHKNVENRLVK